MNIFALDENPRLAAEYHNDRHVVKMILETAQMLSTAHRLKGNEQQTNNENIYKKAYPNHPCTIWVRETSENYIWALQLFIALNQEYEYRFKKTHASLKLLPDFMKLPANLVLAPRTPFAQAMPDYCKHADSITAYRQYYFVEKGHLFKWTKRDVPEWISPTSPNFLKREELILNS